jgi:pyridoxamine 5'-phosphate oxidase
MKNDIVRRLRREYEQNGLLETEIHSDPILQFENWFDSALEAQVEEANAMTLATADTNGKVSARIVLLKGFDKKGFTFFTNYLSKKGKQISENPSGALVFFWKELERQVRIEGKIEKVSEAESIEYYNVRPVGSRLGSWASAQSSVIPNREELEKRQVEFEQKFEGKDIPKPEYWGGYRLVPNEIEFWQGRPNRLHDRIRYTLIDGKWQTDRLAP